MRDFINRLDNLIDVESPSDKNQTTQDANLWSNLEKQLHKWESDKKEGNDFITKELPMIKAERNQMQHRTRKLIEIIAKAKLLLSDLNEDYAKELTKGESLTNIGEALKRKFGDKLDEDQNMGEHTIKKFLREYFKLSKHSSRELLTLIEDAGIIQFRIDIPKNEAAMPIMYEPLEEEVAVPEVMYPLYGCWKINA